MTHVAHGIEGATAAHREPDVVILRSFGIAAFFGACLLWAAVE